MQKGYTNIQVKEKVRDILKKRKPVDVSWSDWFLKISGGQKTLDEVFNE